MNKMHFEVSHNTFFDVIYGSNIIIQLQNYLKNISSVLIMGEQQNLIKEQIFKLSYLKYVFPSVKKEEYVNYIPEVLTKWKECSLNKESALIVIGDTPFLSFISFLASSYLDGIKLIEIPTSLYAMANSSINGKSKIILKNAYLGKEAYPYLILNDLSLLSNYDLQGVIELLKDCVLFSYDSYQYFKKNSYKNNIEILLNNSLKIKQNSIGKEDTFLYYFDELRLLFKENGNSSILSLSYALLTCVEEKEIQKQIVSILKKLGVNLNNYNTSLQQLIEKYSYKTITFLKVLQVGYCEKQVIKLEEFKNRFILKRI